MSDRKVVLVTGGNRGIGKEIALRFLKEDYDVVITYSRESSESSAQDILKSSGQSSSVAVKCDISKTQEIKNLFSVINDKYGKIDVLVNNAGITKDGLAMRMSDEQFCDVIDVNLKGTFCVIREVLPQMMKRRFGNIVNISSIVGIHGNPGQVNYSASKAGIIGLTKSIAKEVASRNIIVNAVAPGAIDTDMFSSLGDNIKQSVISTIPLARLGKGEEVADLVYFLANQSYITGQVIQIDGGMGI